MRPLNSEIPTLSPYQVKSAYLKRGSWLDGKLREDFALFNIVRIEDLLPFLKIPNPPFRNVSHGFVFIQQGTIQMQLDAFEYILKENCFIITPAGQINNFINIDKSTKGFMGTFHDDFFNNTQLNPGLKTFANLLNPEHLPHFTLDNQLLKVFTSICERLLAIYSGAGNGKIDLTQNYLQALLTELDMLFQMKKKAQLTNGQRIVLAFKQLLFRNIRHTPKPSDLARMLNISINHLNKILKQNTQYSTSEWIAKRQIIEAKLMLKNSGLSISEISYELGFEDPSYFSRFFFKYTQRTPSQYRNDC